DGRRDRPWHDFPPFVVVTNALLVRSIRSSKQLSGRVSSRQRMILTRLHRVSIIFLNFIQNYKDYASNETQVAVTS
ncbi:hypothetical protein V1477_001706, partial [Vespula maculifrons]